MNLKACRVCCINEGTLYIFDKGDFEIGKQIMICCPKLTIIEGDGLPAYICKNCEQDLIISCSFIKKCEVSDYNLRLLKTGNLFQNFVKKESKSQSIVKLEDSSDHDQYDDDLCDDGIVYNQADELPQVSSIKTEEQFSNNIKHKKVNKNLPKSHTLQTCNTCDRVCANPSALVIHKRKHTNDKPFHCLSCDKKYKDKGSLKRHMDRNHNQGNRSRDFMCENCGKGFFSKTDVITHMRVHTGETPYGCSLCPMMFKQVSAMLRHKKRHSGEKTQTCSTCDKKFCTKDELKNHQKVHTNDKKFRCQICNSLFKYKNNLKKHMLLHSQPNSFICNYCGRMFNVKGNLKLHIDKQHSEKSGFCEMCSKSVSELEVHMWRHTGQRPLKCELCNSSFYELKALAHHISFRHKNTDKHKCTVQGCSMSFPSRPMLDYHKYKIHETIIPFPCDRCSRGFYRKNDLARHKKGTHKEILGD